jgi:hypothetical protein
MHMIYAPVRGSQAVVSADISVTFDLFVVRRGHDKHLYLYQGTKRRFSLGFSLTTRNTHMFTYMCVFLCVCVCVWLYSTPLSRLVVGEMWAGCITAFRV